MKYLGFIRANLRRNKLRTALTGGAITLAVALVCLLLTMPAGLDALVEQLANNTRISVHNKAGIVYSMPYAFTRKVRQVDGVAAAVAITWFGGAFEEQGRVTFPNFAVETEHVGAVYPDYKIDPQQLADFQRYRDGAIVGRQTMKSYGWKIGDRITLRSTVWPVNLDLRIVGEIPNERAPMLWLSREYLDQALQAAGPARPRHRRHHLGARRRSQPGQRDHAHDRRHVRATARRRPRARPRRASSPTSSARCRASSPSCSSSPRLVALCIVFIAANTASMAVRERSGELAVLKAIGFTRGVIFGTLLAEAVVLSTRRRPARRRPHARPHRRAARRRPAGTTRSARSAASWSPPR